MYTKKQNTNTSSESNQDWQKRKASKASSHFSDNRPEALQLKMIQQKINTGSPVLQKSENKTGLPDKLKSGVENLSGYSLDDVQVHYNSDKPAQLQAHAYAQGSDIHLAPGQEKHLPHEAWHVVQQKQGRVKSTLQKKGGVNINDDAGLEKEADVMGAKALELKAQTSEGENGSLSAGNSSAAVVQQMPDWMLKLIELAKENKVVAGTVAVGAAGILLYYYCKKKPGSVPPTIEDELDEPTFERLKSLADMLNVKVGVLKAQLETGDGDISVNDFYKKGIDHDIFAPMLVPPTLLAGLPEEEGAKFNMLLERFHALSFTYTGQQNSAGTGFLSRTGDCSTLAQMFRFATVAAGIEGVEYKSDENPMLVPSASIHGRNTTGNVDGMPCWVFVDHHWCEYKGVQYDLLFKRTGMGGTYSRGNERSHNEVSYYVFTNGYAIIYSDMFHLMSTKLSEGTQGHVSENEDAIIQYIETYKKN